MNTQYRKNLKAVAQACKDYTDEKIKKVYYDIGHNDISTEDHTNEATYRFTAPANAKLLMLQSIGGNSVKYSPSVASDSTSAYQKTIPSYSPSIDRASASMNILGGMSYKVNQLVGNLKATFTTGGVTFTNNGDGSMTLNGTATEEIGTVSVGVDVTANITFPRRSHKVLVTCNNTLSGFYIGVSGYSINNSGAFLFNESNPTDWTNGIGCHIVAGTVFNNFKIIPQVFDLTTDFGSGNEPSTVSDCATEYAKRGVDIYSYTPQQSAIRDTAPTSVVSKDSNDTTIDTLSINASIQALDGYGWGVNDTCYNYVDFNSKKFIQKVGKYTFTGNESFSYKSTGRRWTISNIQEIQGKNETSNIKTDIPNIYRFGSTFQIDNSIYVGVGAFQIADSTNLPNTMTSSQVASYLAGKTIYFELNTPIETDISQYLDGNEIEIEPNGTLSFESTYSAYVPSNVSYNGVIKHALATAVKQDGFNVWDEVWELGTIGEGGVLVDSTIEIRSKNYINVLPNTTYYLNTPDVMIVHFWDENFNYIKNEYIGGARTYTTPTNARYMKFRMRSTYGTTYKNDICINISNQDLNGTYKPHKPTYTRALTNNEAKYSWGITNGVRNVRTYCDDEGNPVNEGQLDVGNQDLGGLNWEYQSEYQRFRAVIDIKGYNNNETANVLINKYTVYSWNSFTISVDMAFSTYALSESVHYIYIRDTNYTDAPTFKTAMNGEMLWYQKNTTDTETLDDFDYFFDCEEGDTFTIIGCELLQCYATYSFLIKEAKSNE